MKKTLFLSIFICSFIRVASAQTTWIDYKVDEKISVKLPVQPKTIQGNVYATDKDSSMYIIAIIDFLKVTGVDSVAMAPMEPTPQFGDQLKTGMLSQMPGYTLGDVKIYKWHGHYTYKGEGSNAGKKLKTYVYMICWGNTMYSLMVIAPEKNPIKGKDDFFASLKAT